MSPVVVLLGLLALAYVGSMLIGGRAIRGFGLPSGTEFLLLGIVVGPQVLGFVTRSSLDSVQPLTRFVLIWLGLTIGLHYGYLGERRVRVRRMLAGLGLALLTLAMTGAAVASAAWVATDIRGNDLAVLALGCAAASTETTRHAVRWVNERYGAQGPLSQLVAEVSEADDAVPIGILAILAVLVPETDTVTLPLPAWVLVVATIAAGAIIGATCAALVDVERRTSQRWGILLGCALLAGGAALRLGLSATTAAFVMGISTSALARESVVLQRMVASSERAVLLATLFFAGACVTWPSLEGFGMIVAAAVVARLAAKLATARLLTIGPDYAGVPRVALGLGLLPAGVLTMTVGLACTFRFPGAVGDAILALAAINTAIGEVIGPAALRRTLRTIGEIPSTAGVTPIPRPRARPSPRGRGSRGSRGSLSGATNTDPPPAPDRTGVKGSGA